MFMLIVMLVFVLVLSKVLPDFFYTPQNHIEVIYSAPGYRYDTEGLMPQAVYDAQKHQWLACLFDTKTKSMTFYDGIRFIRYCQDVLGYPDRVEAFQVAEQYLTEVESDGVLFRGFEY